MVQNNIKTQTQLLATINIQKEEGKWIWLAMFSLEHQKSLDKCKDLEDAKCSNHFTAAKTYRMDIIHEVSLGSCVEGCNGSWLK